MADTAKKIADDDDLSVNVKDYLLHMNDETGSLSTSFNAMLLKLRKKIDEQATFNSALEKAKKETEEKNEDLLRFNKVFVDREIKMVELKKRIAELEHNSKVL